MRISKLFVFCLFVLLVAGALSAWIAMTRSSPEGSHLSFDSIASYGAKLIHKSSVGISKNDADTLTPAQKAKPFPETKPSPGLGAETLNATATASPAAKASSNSAVVPAVAPKKKLTNPADPAYIQNDKIRLGVDLGSGGGIFYFSERTPERNLLNHVDKGRFIQQSYYGLRDGSMWNKKPWCWNPVQGGNWKGQPAKVLESTISSDSLYVKTMPKNWSTGGTYGEDIKDAVMEEWIELQGNVAKIHFRFTYSGPVNHGIQNAELPAFFADGALANLVTYDGTAPWTGGELNRKVPFYLQEKSNKNGKPTESWAAYVDDKDWGVGLFFPGITEITYYRFNGVTGPMGGGCSYFAPVSRLIITKDFVYNYTIYLTIGTANEIRERFYAIHTSLTPPASDSVAQPAAATATP